MQYLKKQLATYTLILNSLSSIYSSKDRLFKVVATRILTKTKFVALILHTTKVSIYAITGYVQPQFSCS